MSKPCEWCKSTSEKIDSLEYENEQLKKLLRFHEPYSTLALVEHLAKAASILLDKQNYSGDGWETINSARCQAVSFLAFINNSNKGE